MAIPFTDSNGSAQELWPPTKTKFQARYPTYFTQIEYHEFQNLHV